MCQSSLLDIMSYGCRIRLENRIVYRGWWSLSHQWLEIFDGDAAKLRNLAATAPRRLDSERQMYRWTIRSMLHVISVYDNYNDEVNHGIASASARPCTLSLSAIPIFRAVLWRRPTASPTTECSQRFFVVSAELCQR